ncbi:MAG TPA: EthD family reductase [Rhodanobacteraceae bacterium]|nr:EthD family reductase [Rhodanobacteraceae bacterium]
MLKFVVVIYRRPDLPLDDFLANLRNEHGPLAERIPGLRRYVQNYVLPDGKRRHLGWDAIVELYWDDWASMEAAWATPEGQAATEHLETLADLSRTTWSVVEEHVRR